MNDAEINFEPIGYIHTPHKEAVNTPVQPVFCDGIEGKIELKPEYADGLKGLDGFSHIYLFFYFNKSQKTCLRLSPYLSDEEQGIFATRAPHRPNKLGMSVVRLLKIEENTLYVSEIDILDGTPLLDIKPYVERFDSRTNVKSGWQEKVADNEAHSRGLRNFKNIEKGK